MGFTDRTAQENVFSFVTIIYLAFKNISRGAGAQKYFAVVDKIKSRKQIAFDTAYAATTVQEHKIIIFKQIWSKILFSMVSELLGRWPLHNGK